MTNTAALSPARLLDAIKVANEARLTGQDIEVRDSATRARAHALVWAEESRGKVAAAHAENAAYMAAIIDELNRLDDEEADAEAAFMRRYPGVL